MGNLWTYERTATNVLPQYRRKTEDIFLVWNVYGEEIMRNYPPTEHSAAEVIQHFVTHYSGREQDEIQIAWTVYPSGQGAPFLGKSPHFLETFTWPKHSDTGDLLNWLTLQVVDQIWEPDLSTPDSSNRPLAGSPLPSRSR